MPRVRPIRRVITRHDAAGRSVVVSDVPSPHVMTLAGADHFGVTDLWKTYLLVQRGTNHARSNRSTKPWEGAQ